MMVLFVLLLNPPEPEELSPAREADLEAVAEEVVVDGVDEVSLVVVGFGVGVWLGVVCGELVEDWELVDELSVVVLDVEVVDEEDEEELEEEEELLLEEVEEELLEEGVLDEPVDDAVSVAEDDGVLLGAFVEEESVGLSTGPRRPPPCRPSSFASKRAACVTAMTTRRARIRDCGRYNMIEMLIVELM
jgi:hypothetical protein